MNADFIVERAPPSSVTTRVKAQAGHPLLAAWDDHRELIQRAEAIGIDELEQRRAETSMRDGCARPRFCAQSAALLSDGLHYETRILERDVLATREHNAHDLFNALIWLRHARLKRALNARQVADIARIGVKRRTRGQCALTHFDEAGAIVWLTEPALLDLWDAHDWHGFFLDRRAAWGVSIGVTVFGHALIEHVWRGQMLPVAKALVVVVPAAQLASRATDAGAIVCAWPDAEQVLAAAIADGRLLADPQELRPLPLAGIPDWHPLGDDAAFYTNADCFRPLRVGRRYPPPFIHGDS